LDKLAHASLIDAVRATGEPFRVFPHNHMAKLERLLAEADEGELQVVVTESIFSMDGDAADLSGLADLKQRHPFVLILDEAHATGVYGPNGAGLAAEAGLSSLADLTTVTLSKGLGSLGGAVCSSAAWGDAVLNFGRAAIYTTNIPPSLAAVARAATEVLRDEPTHQARVRDLARHVRTEVKKLGFTLPVGDSPIIPLILGDELLAVAAAETLRESGLIAVAVRPPTVPPNTSRLRVTLSSAHTGEEVEHLLATLAKLPRPAAP
jgi:7-keto-8-aminopelargonate synthetase-like enzyme